MTDSGRTVYGGGGITPDEKYDVAQAGPPADRSCSATACSISRAPISRTHSAPRCPKGWMPDDQVLERTARLPAEAHGTVFTEAEFTKDRDWIKRYLASEMYISAFNVDESDAMFARTDPEVEKAVELMPKAAALLGEREEDHRAAHERAADGRSARLQQSVAGDSGLRRLAKLGT